MTDLELLTVTEVASLLRTTPEAIYARIDRGSPPVGYFRDGRRILFVKAKLVAWIEEQTGGG